jgi:dihydrofolate reductase
MNTIVAFKAVSVDGYAAGPDEDLSRLHAWMDRPAAAKVTRGFFAAGAVVMGRRTFAAARSRGATMRCSECRCTCSAVSGGHRYTRAARRSRFVGDLGSALDLARRVAGDRPVNLTGPAGSGGRDSSTSSGCTS